MKLIIYSDYVCPYCYLAKQSVNSIIEKQEIEVEYRPYEIYPYPNPTTNMVMDKEKGEKFNKVIMRVARKMNTEMLMPAVNPWPYTFLAHLGFCFAKEYNKGNEYYDLVINSFFKYGEDIGNLEVLTKTIKSLSLDEKQFIAELENKKYDTKLKEELEQAFIFTNVVPTFVIGSKKLEGAFSEAKILEFINKNK